MNKKTTWGAATPVMLLVLVFVVAALGCEMDGGNNNTPKTVLQGTWESDSGTLTISGYNFTWVDSDGTRYRGTFSIVGDQVTLTISSFSIDGGSTWLTRNQFIDEMIKEFLEISNADWNSIPAADKQELRNEFAEWIDIPSTITYIFDINGSQLTLIGDEGAISFENTTPSTTNSSLEGTWISEGETLTLTANSFTMTTYFMSFRGNYTRSGTDRLNMTITQFSVDGERTWQQISQLNQYIDEILIALMGEYWDWLSDAEKQAIRDEFAGEIPTTATYTYNVNGDQLTLTDSDGDTAVYSRFPPSNTTRLTANQWVNGSLTSSVRQAWYSFSVTAGTTYYIWWDDSDNSSKTLDVKVTAYYSDRTEIFDWDTPNDRSFTASSSGTVYVRVYPYGSGSGTYAIAYSTSSTRPDSGGDVPGEPSISFVPVTYIDADISSVAYVGDYLNLGNVYIYPSNATYQNIYWSVTSGSGSAYISGNYLYFNSTGSVTVRATVYSGGTGQNNYTQDFNITVYSNSGDPSEWTPPSSHTPLTANQWVDSSLTSSVREEWYSFNVISGQTYYVWWNDNDNNSSTGSSKTLDIQVAAYYNNGTMIFDWDYPNDRSFTPTSSGTVYVRVYPYGSGSGTYAIAYSTSSTRPIAWTLPANHTPLTASQWVDSSLTSSVREEWYSFNVIAGSTYYIWWNDTDNNYSTGNSKTLDIQVATYYSDGETIFVQDTPNSYTITASASDTVYVKVYPYSSGTGTYGIAYSTTNTRP